MAGCVWGGWVDESLCQWGGREFHGEWEGAVCAEGEGRGGVAGGKVAKEIRLSVGCTKAPCEYCLEKGTWTIMALGPVCANSHACGTCASRKRVSLRVKPGAGAGSVRDREAGPVSREGYSLWRRGGRPLPRSFPFSLFLCLFVSAFFFLPEPLPNLQL